MCRNICFRVNQVSGPTVNAIAVWQREGQVLTEGSQGKPYGAFWDLNQAWKKKMDSDRQRETAPYSWKSREWYMNALLCGGSKSPLSTSLLSSHFLEWIHQEAELALNPSSLWGWRKERARGHVANDPRLGQTAFSPSPIMKPICLLGLGKAQEARPYGWDFKYEIMQESKKGTAERRRKSPG